MTRTDWLERFLWLCDRNRPANEFARIGIRVPTLKKHLVKIEAYRDELKTIYIVEKAQKRRLEAARRRRRDEEIKRLAIVEKAERDSEDAKAADGSTENGECDS